MAAIKKLLLLTDFSEISDYATQHALQIAKQTGADVTFLHVINTPVDWVKLPLEHEQYYPENKAQIGLAKANLSALGMIFSKEHIKTTETLVYNVGAENIPKYINGKDYDLVIMGSHGASGFREVALGSNAQKVVRHTKVPTLIVKTAPKPDGFKRMVMASDFETDNKAIHKKLFEFCELFESQLDLLYVNTPYRFKETEDIEAQLHAFCEPYGAKKCGRYHVDALNEERGVAYFMKQSNADILSIATTGKSGLAQLFSPSVTEAVINHLDVPTLVFHI
jgi:nucleotide-binding universal stress UspA family protein